MTDHIKSYNAYIILIGVYFLCLIAIAPFNLLSFDTYYYWDWSRHLQLSYYDGAPMIAYLIRLTTILLGSSLYALNLAGIVINAITCIIIYQAAHLFLDRKPSYIATLLWLFSPLVTQNLFGQLTYDTPLNLFWACSLYFTLHYLKTNLLKDLYYLGVSLGLLLLSKYSGVVLIFSLLLFTMTSSYRHLLKNVHFYIAITLTLLFFSPVLIWNYHHEWVSFAYQWHTHHIQQNTNPIFQALQAFLTQFLLGLNAMLLMPLLFMKTKDKLTAIHYLLITICGVFTVFYLLLSMNNHIRTYWLTPYLISSALIGGYCFQSLSYAYQRAFYCLIGLYILASGVILSNNCLHFMPSHNLNYYKIIQQLNRDYPHVPKSVFTLGWMPARLLFFLTNQPMIYTLDCGGEQNQYQFWSQDIVKAIESKRLKNILFIDMSDQLVCLKRYFTDCTRIPTMTYAGSALFVYQCVNNQHVLGCEGTGSHLEHC